jgi:hypothetical protein
VKRLKLLIAVSLKTRVIGGPAGVGTARSAREIHYFAGDGRMIDQAYQSRLSEDPLLPGVHDKVAGFGHQAINAPIAQRRPRSIARR